VREGSPGPSPCRYARRSEIEPTTTRSRPWPFARYIARSTARKQVSASGTSPCSRQSAGALGVGGGDRHPQLFGDRPSLGEVDVAEDHRELIAADPRGDVGCGDPLVERLTHHPDQPVAGDVAVGVVDRLEAIEVEQQQRRALAALAASADLPPQLLLEAAPVVERGDRIAVGQFVGMRLEPLALGDVLDLGDEMARRAVLFAHDRDGE
jgi:hypothetical protein